MRGVWERIKKRWERCGGVDRVKRRSRRRDGGSQGTGQYTGFVSYACALKMCKVPEAKAKAQKAVQAGLALSSGGR